MISLFWGVCWFRVEFWETRFSNYQNILALFPDSKTGLSCWKRSLKFKQFFWDILQKTSKNQIFLSSRASTNPIPNHRELNFNWNQFLTCGELVSPASRAWAIPSGQLKPRSDGLNALHSHPNLHPNLLMLANFICKRERKFIC